MRNWIRRLSLLTISTLPLVSSAAAQNSAPSATPSPTIQAQARAVLVDVVVTKENQPALHLQQQDFQILDNGRPQTINFFQENTAPSASAAPIMPPLTPREFTNQPTTSPGTQVTVLLLDKLNTRTADQAAFLEGVRGFVRGLRTGTPVAVFTLTSRLNLVQGFTGDPTKLQAAMSGKSAPEPGNTAFAHTAQDDAMDRLQAAGMAAFLGIRDDSAAPMNQFRANERTSLTLQALNQLSRFLAGIPGRKNLIWYASDFPLAIFPDARAGQTLAQDRTMSSDLRTTAALLAAARVAVYPVSAAGIANDNWTQAADKVENASIDGMQQQTANDQSARAANIAAMERIATDTGGRAIYTTNNLEKATTDAMQNGAHYYTLAYTPADLQPDGSFHRIEVRLQDHKEKLEYRRGYFADDSSAPVTGADPLIPLLADGMPSATQIIYQVSAAPAPSQPASGAPAAGGNRQLAGPLTRYVVNMIVPANSLDLTAAPDGTHSGDMEVALVAYDHKGKAINWTGGASSIHLTSASWAAAQQQGIPLRLQVDLPHDALMLATGIYNPKTRKAGTLEFPLDEIAHP
ncbi:MAG: VWA domain-containing protein [Acidobacteriota bacterium]|nr:VWA domain-containing protein [Acidobacteriota bacterium]